MRKSAHTNPQLLTKGNNSEKVFLGAFSKQNLDYLLKKGSKIEDPGERIDYLSELFIGVAYRNGTLIGNATTPEILVINLNSVDCMTYIEYVEAMRLSMSFNEFLRNVRRVRYRSGTVSFHKRNHFFTDWSEFRSKHIQDVTRYVGGNHAIEVRKFLNKKADGNPYVPGIPIAERIVAYIPSTMFNDSAVEKLNTGDYVGSYADSEGLDVTHAGIIIKKAGSLVLRHASSVSLHKKVISEDFLAYIRRKPGIVVLRATNQIY